jgi:hypothetical protein
VLVVAGGHGAIGELFVNEEGPLQQKHWNAFVVEPLRTAGITARYIILDACLSATMIPTLAPLLAKDGEIISSTVSINTVFLDPDTWLRLLKDLGAKKSAREVIINRLAALQTEGHAGKFAVYDAPTNRLQVQKHVLGNSEFKELQTALQATSMNLVASDAPKLV